ncbi:MAG: exodeoxyribonuclease VII large subunit [Bacteroidales bacterium]|nr:exodeoxyribonuclease VII large subunit [Bacteroidales bacterium]
MNYKSNKDKVYTLTELAREISAVIARSFNIGYWVKAEIAKLNYYPRSGHCYPQLVDKELGTVKADIRGTIWSNDYTAITKKFRQITGEALQDGMKVLCFARVTFHPVYGLSLQILDIEPAFTLGEMAKEKQNTIRRLRKEGVFENNKQLTIPLLPKRIAVISVETSKGYHDFRKIIDDNPWNYGITYHLFSAILQGEKAVNSIIAQLQRISSFADIFDVVVIIRGGGGDVGLNCYDNYELAKTVALFPLPVITGIGHSTNETVTQMVAHLNMITPTDVAYAIIQSFHNFSVRINNAHSILKTLTPEILREHHKHFDTLANTIIAEHHNYLTNTGRMLDLLIMHIAQTPVKLMSKEKAVLLNKQRLTRMLLLQQIEQQKLKIIHAVHSLSLLHPDNVLKRGYSITRHNGKAITKAKEVSSGDQLEVTLREGKLITEVK